MTEQTSTYAPISTCRVAFELLTDRCRLHCCLHEMAPKKNQESMKQKSLMSFFSKPSGNKGGKDNAKVSSLKPAAKSRPPAPRSSSPPAESDYGNRTPASKGSAARVVDASYTRSSDGGSSFKDTPPTSDPIDVDMEDIEDGPPQTVSHEMDSRVCTSSNVTGLQNRKKRKIVIDDSDDSMEELDSVAYKKGLSAYRPSPIPQKASSKSMFILIPLHSHMFTAEPVGKVERRKLVSLQLLPPTKVWMTMQRRMTRLPRRSRLS